MKKVVSLLLAIMLILSCVSAFAAEYTDKEIVKKVQQALNDAGFDCGTPDGIAGKKTYAAITDYQTAKGLTVSGVIDDELLIAMDILKEYTFQGIPWGSSPKEAGEILVDNGLLPEKIIEDLNDERRIGVDENGLILYAIFDTASYYMENFEDLAVIQENSFCHESTEGIGIFCEFKKIEKTVGGYKASWIRTNYLYEIVNDSIVENPGLSLVKIQFEDKDISSDLLAKLTESYGNYTDTKSGWAFPSKCWIWRGVNSTSIILMQDMYDVVSLYYANTGDTELGQQLEELYKKNTTPSSDAGL